ncbi:hypothetical protein [Neptuniibacter marinus]|uniref:hypothetical protein n=1 Tax=Neptuniibacter marinus TaxID=1806670 RepID=UPI000831E68D|nr:hypothetical protein [Neptuniibacter marinus]
MNYKKAISILLATLLLTACSGMRGGLTKNELDSSNNIAVVSLLGTNFNGIHIGTTIFSNVVYEETVPEWNIDGFTEELIISRLNQSDLRTAVVLQHDPNLKERLKKTWSFLNGYDYKELIESAKNQGADTLILVKPTRYDNKPFHEPGYGFYERSFLGNAQSCVYSLFTMTVFSTNSGQELGWEWGFPCETGEVEIKWKDSFDQYTKEETQLLRLKVENSVKQNVLSALRALGY